MFKLKVVAHVTMLITIRKNKNKTKYKNSLNHVVVPDLYHRG